MNICVITTSRADYGLLKPLLKRIRDHDDLHLTLIAVGSHFSEEHGNTYQDILLNGFEVERIETYKKDDVFDIALSGLEGIIDFAIHIRSIELLIVLGDRYELIPPCYVATLFKIPIAHIHAGEITEGSFDNQIRYAISAMAHVHFTSTQRAKDRLKRMGEPLVFHVGALGLEGISGNYVKEKNKAIVIYHPETLEESTEVLPLLDFLKTTSLNITFIGANADPGNSIISRAFQVFAKKYGHWFYPSMKREEFIQELGKAQYIIGNSSAGIIEAPSLRTITINIGDRQKGRERASSIRDYKMQELHNRLVFSEVKSKIYNPYYKHEPSKNILRILLGMDLKRLVQKRRLY